MKSEVATSIGILVCAMGSVYFIKTMAAIETKAQKALVDLRADVDLHEARLKKLEASLPRSARPTIMKTTFYGKAFHRKKMANGGIYDMRKNTVAHRTLLFGTHILLEHKGRSAVGTVTDRGPALKTGNDLDVSEHLAHVLGMHRAGVAKVQVTRLN